MNLESYKAQCVELGNNLFSDNNRQIINDQNRKKLYDLNFKKLKFFQDNPTPTNKPAVFQSVRHADSCQEIADFRAKSPLGCMIDGCDSPFIWMGQSNRRLLLIDHIDKKEAGNSENNLRLTCCNCNQHLTTSRAPTTWQDFSWANTLDYKKRNVITSWELFLKESKSEKVNLSIRTRLKLTDYKNSRLAIGEIFNGLNTSKGSRNKDQYRFLDAYIFFDLMPDFCANPLCQRKTWRGLKIAPILQLHHLDDNANNNHFSNIIGLCPCCHYNIGHHQEAAELTIEQKKRQEFENNCEIAKTSNKPLEGDTLRYQKIKDFLKNTLPTTKPQIEPFAIQLYGTTVDNAYVKLRKEALALFPEWWPTSPEWFARLDLKEALNHRLYLNRTYFSPSSPKMAGTGIQKKLLNDLEVIIKELQATD
jgi:hypothetical protein